MFADKKKYIYVLNLLKFEASVPCLEKVLIEYPHVFHPHFLYGMQDASVNPGSLTYH